MNADQRRAFTRRAIEYSTALICASREAGGCALACVADLRATMAQADEVIRRVDAVFAAHEPDCIEPDLSRDDDLDVACRVAAVLQRAGYQFRFQFFSDVIRH